MQAALLGAVVLGLAAPPPAESVPPTSGGSNLSATISLTPQYRWLFGIPVYGAEVSGAFGMYDQRSKRFQAEVALNGLFARTRAGLPILRGSVGALLDFRVSGLHMGGLLGAGMLGVGRAGGGRYMTGLTVPTNLFVGPEFEVSPGFVLSVDATLALDWVDGARLIDLWGPGIGVRARVF